MENFEKIKELIAGALNCDESEITPEALLKEDLSADSLDAVELIMAVEDEFGITVPKEKAESIRTVGDIADAVNSLVE